MTDRNELAKLYAQSKEYMIGKNLPEDQKAKITLRRLSLDETDLIGTEVNQTLSREEKKDKMIKLISKSMNALEDDVRPLDITFLEEIMLLINHINDVKVKKDVTRTTG